MEIWPIWPNLGLFEQTLTSLNSGSEGTLNTVDGLDWTKLKINERSII